jgi:hypothetical protein
VVVEAPLRDDRERSRWYADGGKTCLALTESGELLEPVPTYGPALYRLVASEVQFSQAQRYASANGFHHLRRTC